MFILLLASRVSHDDADNGKVCGTIICAVDLSRRSKRSLGWRTCLIVPELEHETSVANRYRHRAFTPAVSLSMLTFHGCHLNTFFRICNFLCIRERALHSEVLRLKQEQHDLDEYADQLSSVSVNDMVRTNFYCEWIRADRCNMCCGWLLQSLEGGDASVTAQLTCTHTQAETVSLL